MARTLIRGSLQIQSGTLVNALWSTGGGADRLAEVKVAFDTVAGHNHDGSNSRTVSGGGRVYEETLGGTVNGTNTDFTLATSPSADTTVRLHYNGQRIRKGVGNDYTISGTDIVMLFTPLTNDILFADYNI